MFELLKMKQPDAEIRRRRIEVAQCLTAASPNIKDGTIKMISAADLKLMFELYDRIFFNHWFTNVYKGKLKFSLSRRMTKSAGLTLCSKKIKQLRPDEIRIEIRIGVDFLFQYGLVEGNKSVCGIMTSDSLNALQLVFEHELCHVIEFVLFGESACSRERFKAIANSFFGHTESYHRLPTHKEIAHQKFGLNIGNTVHFIFEGKKHEGILYNINKRATVMVRDINGTHADKDGNRYAKYYVPLTALKLKGD